MAHLSLQAILTDIAPYVEFVLLHVGLDHASGNDRAIREMVERRSTERRYLTDVLRRPRTWPNELRCSVYRGHHHQAIPVVQLAKASRVYGQMACLYVVGDSSGRHLQDIGVG